MTTKRERLDNLTAKMQANIQKVDDLATGGGGIADPGGPLTTLLARLADARSLEEVRQAAQEATQP